MNTIPARQPAGTPTGGQFTTSAKGAVVGAALTTPEPTEDQSYCDVGQHQACSGYTEDEMDPESCMCHCHTPEENRR